MTKTELLEKKGRLANEAHEILEKAHADGREALRAEEETKFNAIHLDIEAISKHVGLIDKQERTERELAEPGARRTEPNAIATGSQTATRDDSTLTRGRIDQQDAVRGWLMASSRNIVVPDQFQAAAKRVGLDLRSNSLTFRLAATPIRGSWRSNGTYEVTQADRDAWMNAHREDQQYRALAGPQSSTSTGGYTIQDAAMRELEVALLAYGGMRQTSTIIRTDTDGPLPIPTCNDTTNVGALVAQGTTVGTQDVAFGQLVLDGFTYTSKAILVSIQLLQDNSINLSAFLGRALGERIGRILNTHFTVGTGTGQPNGIVTAATATQAATGQATSFLFATLVNFQHSVDPSYRTAARWMMNDTTIGKIKQMVDSQGRPLWLPGLANGAPDTLLGSPYVVNQDVAAITASAKSILYGALDKYIIRDIRDVTLMRLDERYAEFLQVGFLAFARADGDLLDAGTHPVRVLQNSAT